jgi:hypothetical protein
MKKIVVALLLFISFIGYSQTNGITYQAVILNPSGDQLPGVNNTNAPLANKYICLKFSIIDQNLQFEYIETVQTTTDEFGMVNLIIGTGDQIGGYASSFSTILWNANPKSLKVDLSTTGVCSYYTEISNQPFTAVPFALFAATAGTPGTPGPAGPQGIQGVAGPTGATGPAGAVGPQGAQGLPGTNGTNGVDGAVGATGPQGLQGIQGPVGPQGAQGLPGTNGTNGIDGAVGPQGPQGLQGVQGAVGPQGDQGLQGIQGVAGPQGDQGLQGIQGVAGPAGADGLQGLQGIQGVAGPAGADGLQGLQGIQGPIGPQGDVGSPGSDATVTIGAINSTSDPKGATINAGELKLAPADASNGGIVTTGTQTFGGSKIFSSDILVNGITVGNGAGNEFNTKLNVLGSASFRTNVTNSGLIFDGYSPSGSLEVSRIYTDATSGTPSDFVLGTYPNAHSNQLYLKQSNGFVGIKTASPTTALDVNGTVTATSYVKSGGSSSEFLKADGSVDNATYLTATGTAANVSGVVAIANGGTAATTAAEALTNLGAAPIASPTFTGTVTAPIFASTPQALTDAATISWNPANGLNASVTLGGNRTLSFSSTPAVGSYGTLIVSQDATGGRTITLPSTSNKVLGSTSTTTIALSSAANAKDILNFYYDGTNCYWNVGQGYGTAATVASTNLTSSVSGTLPIANGGTGATTKATAFDALSPMTTSGDIIYGGLNGTGTRLSKGSNGSILTMENDLPTWNTSIKATAGSTYNAPVGFSFIGGDWARNTGMFSDNPDAGGSATLKFRIATSNSTANSYLEINPSKVSVLPTTASTSKTTGALTVAGGLGVNGDIYTNNLNASGTVTAGSVTYPNAHGTANQVLSTTGSGTLTWITPVSSAASLTGTLAVANGGNGLSTTPANGQIDIGNGTGFTRATLTAGTGVSISNGTGSITINASPRSWTDQPATVSANQTSFTLTYAPPSSVKVWMFINGVRTNNNAYSVSGTTVTYTPANNNNYSLLAGDRIQFDYTY